MCAAHTLSHCSHSERDKTLKHRELREISFYREHTHIWEAAWDILFAREETAQNIDINKVRAASREWWVSHVIQKSLNTTSGYTSPGDLHTRRARLRSVVSHSRPESGVRTTPMSNIIDERRRDEISITGRERNWRDESAHRRETARALRRERRAGKRGASLPCRGILRPVSPLNWRDEPKRGLSRRRTNFLAFSRGSLRRNALRLIIFLKIRPSYYGYRRPRRKIIYANTRAEMYVR